MDTSKQSCNYESCSAFNKAFTLPWRIWALKQQRMVVQAKLRSKLLCPIGNSQNIQPLTISVEKCPDLCQRNWKCQGRILGRRWWRGERAHDFGKVVQLKARRKVTDHENFVLSTKHFTPPHNYKFPAHSVSGHNRHFQQSWLDQHIEPVYSESEDGGCCKYCVLFAWDVPGMELGVLVNRPLTDYKRASEKLSDHSCHKQFHKASLEAAATYIHISNEESRFGSW